MPPRSLRDEWLIPTLESLLSREQVAELRSGGQESCWEAAVRSKFVTDEAILEALAKRFRMKIADLATVNPNGRDLIPEGLARRYGVVPVAITDSTVEVATADPTDLDCERALGFACGRKVRLTLGAPRAIAEAIELLYAPEAQADSVIASILEKVADKYDVQAVTQESEQADLANLQALADAGSDRPVIKLVDYVVAEGITSRASDIHLEPEENGCAVRYRIDGVLRQVMALPRAAGIPLVSRIKIISGLDIADRLRPQDGRARVVVNGKAVDLRVSTLPATHGEKVVIRILDGGTGGVSFDAMGLNAEELDRLQRLLQVREGVILVTGPTGSGKTTTLYSALRELQQRGGVNIVTVEDPVEYRLPGIVQVQVNERAGLTFASALRSILRQDPDVVLVGEIRDRETAGIAVQASLTGHLVFSTLHTIDAASSVTRLVDIGVENYKIGAALKGVVAQRLLRRLCRACKRPAPAAPPRQVRHWVPEGVEHFEAAGCAECGNTGYRGRLALMEVLIVDGEVERRIAANQPLDRIVEAARGNGMRSLWESGVQHVLDGVTSLDELLRVLDVPADVPAAGSPPARTRVLAPTLLATPVVPPAAADVPSVLTPALFQLVDEPTPPEEESDAAPSVLLVEDELPLRGVLRDLLAREGFEVLEAGDGIEALGTIDRGGPDAVVLDLTLPRLDGYAVLTRLRSRRETQALPVLVLTAREDEEAEVRVCELGADDFLSKPFRPRALIARLRALLRRTRPAHEAPPSLRAVG